MGRGGERFEKRQRERARQQKNAAKRERRHSREPSEPAEGGFDMDALLEEFRVLSERRAAGEVDEETFEDERHRIFVALGMEEPREEDEDADDEENVEAD